MPAPCTTAAAIWDQRMHAPCMAARGSRGTALLGGRVGERHKAHRQGNAEGAGHKPPVGTAGKQAHADQVCMHQRETISCRNALRPLAGTFRTSVQACKMTSQAPGPNDPRRKAPAMLRKFKEFKTLHPTKALLMRVSRDSSCCRLPYLGPSSTCSALL